MDYRLPTFEQYLNEKSLEENIISSKFPEAVDSFLHSAASIFRDFSTMDAVHFARAATSKQIGHVYDLIKQLSGVKGREIPSTSAYKEITNIIHGL